MTAPYEPLDDDIARHWTRVAAAVMEVAVMSLSAREQLALDGIADRLTHSDARLASLLATFNRLASGEDMPTGEKVSPVRRDPLRRARWVYQRLGFQRVALLVWLVLGVALLLFALSANHGSGGRPCVRSWMVTCAGPASVHSPNPVGNTATN
jgi:hypothetical protein